MRIVRVSLCLVFAGAACTTNNTTNLLERVDAGHAEASDGGGNTEANTVQPSSDAASDDASTGSEPSPDSGDTDDAGDAGPMWRGTGDPCDADTQCTAPNGFLGGEGAFCARGYCGIVCRHFFGPQWPCDAGEECMGEPLGSGNPTWSYCETYQ